MSYQNRRLKHKLSECLCLLPLHLHLSKLYWWSIYELEMVGMSDGQLALFSWPRVIVCDFDFFSRHCLVCELQEKINLVMSLVEPMKNPHMYLNRIFFICLAYSLGLLLMFSFVLQCDYVIHPMGLLYLNKRRQMMSDFATSPSPLWRTTIKQVGWE